MVPKWHLGKWNQRLKPASPQLFNSEPYPCGLRARTWMLFFFGPGAGHAPRSLPHAALEIQSLSLVASRMDKIRETHRLGYLDTLKIPDLSTSKCPLQARKRAHVLRFGHRLVALHLAAKQELLLLLGGFQLKTNRKSTKSFRVSVPHFFWWF